MTGSEVESTFYLFVKLNSRLSWLVVEGSSAHQITKTRYDKKISREGLKERNAPYL